MMAIAGRNMQFFNEQNTTPILINTVVFIDYQKNPLIYTHNGDDPLSRYQKLEEAPHSTLWRTWFGGGYGPFVGQIRDEDLKV